MSADEPGTETPPPEKAKWFTTTHWSVVLLAGQSGSPEAETFWKLRLRAVTIFCRLDESTLELLKFAMGELNLSARAYDRVLKVARTMADLAGSDKIVGDFISEAIQYRSLDRQLWT